MSTQWRPDYSRPLCDECGRVLKLDDMGDPVPCPRCSDPEPDDDDDDFDDAA